MGQDRTAGKTATANAPAPAQAEPTPRRPYVAPVLVEYGTIAKLTQGTRTRLNDGANTRKRKRCL
jgi:hypothetical protein